MGTGEGAGYNVNIPWNAPVVGSRVMVQGVRGRQTSTTHNDVLSALSIHCSNLKTLNCFISLVLRVAKSTMTPLVP